MTQPILPLLICVCLLGCTPQKEEAKPAAPPSSPDTSTAAETVVPSGFALSAPVDVPSLEALQADPELLALTHCHYTQGPVPNWLLVPEFAQWLTPADAAIARELLGEAEKGFAAHLDQQRGVAQFLTARAECEVLAQRDDGESIAFAVGQRIPLMVDPGIDIGLEPTMDEATRIQLWFEAYGESFEGEFRDDKFGISVVRIDGKWFVDAQLEPLFAAPRRAHKAMLKVEDSMESRDWADAKAMLPEACSHPSQVDACASATHTIDRSLEHLEQTTDIRSALIVEDHKLKGLVSGGGIETTLEVAINNPTAETIDLLWVEVLERGTPRVCRVMSAPPPDDAMPLRLPPGQTSRGWCRLGEQHKGPAAPHPLPPKPGETEWVDLEDQAPSVTIKDIVVSRLANQN